MTDKWYEVSCDRPVGQYVYVQLKGYRVLNFYELVAYKAGSGWMEFELFVFSTW